VTASHWRGETINGSIGLGALVFVASNERPLSRRGPEINDLMTIIVNGEQRGYKIVASGGGEITIQSSKLMMSLVAVPTGHPSHRAVKNRQGGSVWAIKAILL